MRFLYWTPRTTFKRGGRRRCGASKSMRFAPTMIAVAVCSALTACSSLSGGTNTISKYPQGQTVGFEDAKFRALGQLVGRQYSSQSACVAELDNKLEDLLVDSSGRLYKGVTIGEWSDNGTRSVRSFQYDQYRVSCGVRPTPGQPNYDCSVQAGDIFICNSGKLSYFRPAPG